MKKSINLQEEEVRLETSLDNMGFWYVLVILIGILFGCLALLYVSDSYIKIGIVLILLLSLLRYIRIFRRKSKRLREVQRSLRRNWSP